MTELYKQIGKIVVVGVGVACAACAGYWVLHWIYQKLKSFAERWWEDNKRRFKNGENVQIYVDIRDMMNQLKRGKDIILIKMGLKRAIESTDTFDEISLPQYEEEIQTDIECSREKAEKLLEDQNAKRTPLCTMCA